MNKEILKIKVPKTILMVEDDPLLLEVARDILRSKGYIVAEAADGEEALAALAIAKPDLILSDVRMPRCDGFELLRRVRSRSDGKVIPFIFMSARAETRALRQGMSLGADDYVTKPYLAADLLETIETRITRAELINDQLQQQERFLTRILPHELRTPLAGIIGYAEIMTATGNSGETITASELAEFGGSIGRSGQRLLRVAEDIALWAWLKSAKEKAGKDNRALLHKTEITAKAIKDWSEERVCPYARATDLTIQGSPTAVMVPMEGLAQVISHLVENGLKHSPWGTAVVVTIVESEFTSEIRVNDSGRGMSEADLERFGPMRQFDREKFEQQGIGMGLALVQSFAQLAGGEFTLARNPDAAGMTASLMLPRAPAT